jgi:hypothetical protein
MRPHVTLLLSEELVTPRVIYRNLLWRVSDPAARKGPRGALAGSLRCTVLCANGANGAGTHVLQVALRSMPNTAQQLAGNSLKQFQTGLYFTG